MKLFIATILTAFFSLQVNACEEISGEYLSAPENEEHYMLSIDGKHIVLRYRAYTYDDQNNARYEYDVESFGTCEIGDHGYVLRIEGDKVFVTYKEELSHEAFGGTGKSPGILIGFHALGEVTYVRLWRFYAANSR